MLLPNHLYKYRCWNDNAKDIIRQHALYFPNNTQLNDPADCKRPINCEPSLKNVMQAVENSNDYSEQHKHQLRAKVQAYDVNRTEKMIHKAIGNFGICSMSINPDIPKMWNEYADQYRGFCLVFDAKKDFNYFNSGFPVKYVDKIPPYTYIPQSPTLIRELMGYKTKIWEEEEEFRLFRSASQIVSNGSSRLFQFNPLSLVGIIFGKNASTDIQNEVRELCKNSGLEHIQFFHS